mgnify:CR=1 FL=1
MLRETVCNEALSLLRIKHDANKAIEEIKVLSFFAYETKKYRINFSEVDFSSHMDFNNKILKISENCKSNTSEILKDIIVSGTLKYCDELNKVFNYLLELKTEDISYIVYDYDFRGGMNYYEHITDKKVCELLVSLSKDVNAGSVLDICSGEGNILCEYYKNTKNPNLDGIEIHYNSALISKLKLVMLEEDYRVNRIKNADVFSCDMREKYDLVFCNAPWGMRLSREIAEDYNSKLVYDNIKFKADWAFVFKAINSISEKGKAFVLINNSALSNSMYEINRADVIEGGFIETIIQLPQGTLSYTNLGYSILILSNNNDKVRFINAQELFMGNNLRNKKLDVEKIVELYNSNDEKNIYITDKSELKNNNYNLEPVFYINKKNIPQLINPCKLEQIADIIPGFQYTSRNLTELATNEGNVSIVKITNIENGEIDYSTLASADIDTKKVEKYLLKENDILLSTKGTSLKLAIVRNIGDRYIIPQNNLSIIRCTSESINPIYLYSFLSGRTGKIMLESLQKGGAIMSINGKDLREMDIPLLDEETQKLIADKYIILNENIKNLSREIELKKLDLFNICEDIILR